MPNFTFYERRKQATTKFFLSLNLNAVPKKSTLEKFAFFRHFHRIRIKAKKFEKTPIHFKSDVFAAVAVVDAKTPYSDRPYGAPQDRIGENRGNEVVIWGIRWVIVDLIIDSLTDWLNDFNT